MFSRCTSHQHACTSSRNAFSTAVFHFLGSTGCTECALEACRATVSNAHRYVPLEEEFELRHNGRRWSCYSNHVTVALHKPLKRCLALQIPPFKSSGRERNSQQRGASNEQPQARFVLSVAVNAKKTRKPSTACIANGHQRNLSFSSSSCIWIPSSQFTSHHKLSHATCLHHRLCYLLKIGGHKRHHSHRRANK